jgi:DNA-binding NarL/FixJ family response regulator
MIAQGMTNRVIADDLYLSESTIKQETVKIFRCLGVATRQAAAKHAAANGVIETWLQKPPARASQNLIQIEA